MVDHISPLIESQFPGFYREDGRMFIAFLKSYYQWLEYDGNPIYKSRRFLDDVDIDKTLTDYIYHFKDEYLAGIQFEDESNQRLFVKNAIDYHRANGTERGLDLFFRLIYGVSIDVYYPADDLFKLSDGQYIIPTYLEITPSSRNSELINKTITGASSGATAFVEQLVVRKAKSSYIDVIYISNAVGDFVTGELLYIDSNRDNCPSVIGSLNSVTIVSSDGGFSVGEEVKFYSNNGSYAKAVVDSVQDISDVVDISLVDGGFGYNSNSTVITSNTVLTVNSVANLAFSAFETVSQNIISIAFQNANANFTVGDYVFRYSGLNVELGKGKILSKTQVPGSGNGTIIVSSISGNLYSASATANLFSTANTITANNLTLTDKTASGKVMAISSNVILTGDSYIGSFVIGETVYQANASGRVSSIQNNSGSVKLSLESVYGLFRSGTSLTGQTSGATLNVSTYQTKLGLYTLSNTFYADAENKVVGANSTANGYIVTTSTGSGAGFSLSTNSTFTNVEVANINTDFISTYISTGLNATAYGFPHDPAANLTSNTILHMLTYSSVTFGTVSNSSIIAVNPGTNYSEAPFIVILDPLARGLQLYDYIIHYSNSVSSFFLGEIVKQSNSTGGLIANGAIGLVQLNANGVLNVKRLSISNNFSTGYLVGSSSGAIAYIDTVDRNANTNVIGINANIMSSVTSTSGTIKSLRIINSGYGYIDGESITYYKVDNPSVTGTVTTSLGKQGTGEGYYLEIGGNPSDRKAIRDGEYYQEYSYEIRSRIPYDKYIGMLKDVAHPAGTKSFGKYVADESSVTGKDTLSAITTLSAKSGTVAVTSGSSNVVGTSTTFLTDFANNDTISINSINKRILSIANNTFMTLYGQYPTTNVAANYSKVVYN